MQRVVGVGASAGGLEALRELVAHLPPDTGLAIVVLQHLSPSQHGMLASLLSAATTIPVLDAKSPQHRLEPNTIVVVPPRTEARLVDGSLVLHTMPDGERPTLPIDQLFESIASALHERAIGVVLSGTGSDGMLGARAIHAAGGLVYAQAPASAGFDEMPRAVIKAGVVDVTMEPAQLGRELGVLATARDVTTIERIFEQLHRATGIDFSKYKRSTLERRLARRLVKHGLASLEQYSDYLAEHPVEASAVYEDLLVHVTEFFRDGDVLERAVAHLLSTKTTGAIRVWVPGCATGEEVYSIAMLLGERLEPGRTFQVFGSDLSEQSIEVARRAHYATSIGSEVSPERLARWFVADDDGYRIVRELRERCIFTRHDLIGDPPFSRLDLVSCRNLMIYLGAELQERVFPLLHYALEQPGILVLGRAETIGTFDHLFEAVDIDARIYARKPGRAQLPRPATPMRALLRTRESMRSTLDVQRDADSILLARYAPPCVVIDDALDILQVRGRIGAYLEIPPGSPELNVVRMARDGLEAPLRSAIDAARRTKSATRSEDLSVEDDGRIHRFALEVIPLHVADATSDHLLVVFEAAESEPAPRASAPRLRDGDGEVGRLRQELAMTRQHLSSVSRQHLATCEDLEATNEELQSANEELQSSNEELHTAKEEMQSTNEEIEAANEALQLGSTRLRAVNDDLVNVLESVAIGIVIVDLERRVRRFTPDARAVLNLIPSDVGRPIADLQPNLEIPQLDQRIAAVIETLVVDESELRNASGISYRMQIRPYRTLDQTIGGAVIAFVDITALRTARDRATAIVETVPTPLVVLDDALVIRSTNHAFVEAFGDAAREAVGKTLGELGEWRGAELHDRLAAALAGAAFDQLELEYHGGVGDRVFQLGARPIAEAGVARAIIVAIGDVTERRRLERAREATERERNAFLDALSHELRTPLSAILLWAEALRVLPPADPQHARAIDTIIESAHAETAIVDDLLDLAVSRAGGLSIRTEPTDPRVVVEAAIAMAQAEATAKSISITASLAPGLLAQIDPRRLKQVAGNLLSNAIKFTTDGGKIAVALLATQDGMILQVRDTGPGIPKELLARLFEPFAQGDMSRTREHQGLGIGLALARHLVEGHGGTIDVESRVGEGTAFTVRIPVAPHGVDLPGDSTSR